MMKLERNTAAYILFAISLLLVIAIGLLVQAVNLYFGLALTELVLILLPAVVFARRAKQPLAQTLRWRRVDPMTAILSLCTGIGLWGIVASLDRLIKYLIGIQGTVESGEFQMGKWLLLLFVFAVLPAICEESLFRGAIQGTLRRSGSRRAILVTAFLFAAFHLNPVPLVPLFVLGLVFGVMCWRTNSSIASMLAHFGNNAVAVSVPMLAPAEWQIWIMAGCTFLAVIASALFWKQTASIPTETPLLATIDASMSLRNVILTIVLGVVGFASWLTAIVVAGFYLILPLNMPDDSLEPEIGDDDRLIILRNDYFPQALQPNDFVAVEIDGKTTVKRVVSVDDATVRVKDNTSEQSIDASQIRGKLLHNFRRPASEQDRRQSN